MNIPACLRIFSILIFIPVILPAQSEEGKSIKQGWAIHLGAGIMYGGNIGILAENQFILKERFRLSPFAALGVAEGGTDTTSQTYYWLGYASGANLEYGKKHRLIIGPHFTGNNLIGNSVEIRKDFLAGISFIIGYKGTAGLGLIWQLYIGDIYLQDPFSDSLTYFHSSHAGIGIGYKF